MDRQKPGRVLGDRVLTSVVLIFSHNNLQGPDDLLCYDGTHGGRVSSAV